MLAPIAAAAGDGDGASLPSANGANPLVPIVPATVIGQDMAANPLAGARLNPSEAVRKLWAGAEAVCFDGACARSVCHA